MQVKQRMKNPDILLSTSTQGLGFVVATIGVGASTIEACISTPLESELNVPDWNVVVALP